MRKQYRIVDKGFKNIIFIYQDGQLIDSESIWIDEINNKIERLETMGYSRGYLKTEVEAAKLEYEYKLENMI